MESRDPDSCVREEDAQNVEHPSMIRPWPTRRAFNATAIAIACALASCSLTLDFDELRKPVPEPAPDATSPLDGGSDTLEAAADGATTDAPPDTNRPSSPNRVYCATAECNVGDNCCPDASMLHCASSGACDSSEAIRCDGQEDCTSGDICCAENAGNAAKTSRADCSVGCNTDGDDRVVCHPGEPCAGGRTCQPYRDGRFYICL